MNDPWDVKSVRQSDQYISCMKINGVPLLPPVLSKECREEMNNYKFLAQKVEIRIHAFKPIIVESDVDSLEEKIDAPEILSDQSYEYDVKSVNDKLKRNSLEDLKYEKIHTYENANPTLVNDSNSISSKESSKYVIDLSLSINDTAKNLLESNNTSRIESNSIPERDCDCSYSAEKVQTDIDSGKANSIIEDKISFSFRINKEPLSDPIANFYLSQEGPSSLSSKSFTGSLNNLHMESVKETKTTPLLRQRSYTVLKPSPLLLAHLEVQSMSTGVDVKSISMSESLSNINLSNKKRRSWDLETAKVKWSSMALELNEKGKLKKNLKKTVEKPQSPSKHINKKVQQNTPTQIKSVSQDRPTQNIPKSSIKFNPTPKCKKIVAPQHETEKETPRSNMCSNSEDPATCVRELYEKIQNQQLIQMANLIEKQKREQNLLQKVFDEQNNYLFTQLKAIRPKPPNEIKEAWQDKDTNRGPVSLSQLMNKNSEQNCQVPVISTLTHTNNFINKCDKVLKKCKDVSGNIKKQLPKLHKSVEKPILSKSLSGSRTRTHSPTQQNSSTSRRLVYDTSVSSEYDTILTDRTNDTLADLNVTFPSDHSEDRPPCNNTLTDICTTMQPIESPLSVPIAGASCRSTERAIKSMEETIQNSINSVCVMRSAKGICRPPTARERAAATTIVAYAKGYLVRRLMKTERVQATVQTIKDTLLLALQLHQDGNGIWGADVDLHRRLIQQITAACYTLHDTFVASTPPERCAMIATDRYRRKMLATRPPPRHCRPTEL